MFCTKCGRKLVRGRREIAKSPYYDRDTGKRTRKFDEYKACPRAGWKFLWRHDKFWTGLVSFEDANTR